MEKLNDRKIRKSMESWNEDERMNMYARKAKFYLIVTAIVSTVVFILSLFGIS